MKNLLVIGHVWPEPKTTAAGNRMLQLLEAFLRREYNITFISAATKTEYSSDLGAMGVQEHFVKLNDSSFDHFIAELSPNIVLFDRFMVEEQFGWRVNEVCPDALRILNTEDLHSLREFRETRVKQGIEFDNSSWLQQDKTKRELGSIYRSDLTLLVSSFEKRLLTDLIGINARLLYHLPFLLDKIEGKDTSRWPKFEERTDFITYGNGRHSPNVDSFKFLYTDIWQRIRKELPKANLHVYGAYLPQQIRELHNTSKGFMVHGWTDDIDSKIRGSRVVLAPLRFGAGIKGKLTQAMQNGTPSVTSEIGAEGMSGSLQWPGLISNEPESFAEYAITLYRDPDQWKTYQNQGITLINSFYEKQANEKKLFKALADLNESLSEYRNQNFIGALLQHQTMTATKYMSKWIEEKSRRKHQQIKPNKE